MAVNDVVVILVVAITAVVVYVNAAQNHKLLNNVNQINKAQSSWKAGITPVALLPESQFKRLLGAKIPSNVNSLPRKRVQVRNDVPPSFDSREQWSSCHSIWAIKDQGGCGDCWAVSTASAASDRLCIDTNYNIQVNLSAENLMTCCSACAEKGGCNGGDPLRAWQYIQTTGIVTGGDYNSGEGCQPYSIVPTGVTARTYTPPCRDQCTNQAYNTPYNDDLHYGNSAYLLPKDVSQIQNDLLTNGPLGAAFTVYEDFEYYTGGVYRHSWGENKGGHAVRLLGWGTDQSSGEDYWLAANSWNRTWGENGYFRILRGVNECGFENYVTGGVMSS